MSLRSGARWVCEQAAFLLVLASLVAAFAYLIATPAHPIRGTLAIAVSALLAGVLRLVLPSGAVGMLAVRARLVDVFFYLLFGGLIVITDIRLKH